MTNVRKILDTTAGRPFSDGAGFCVADKVLQTCGIGKWSREASEGCRGALADTR